MSKIMNSTKLTLLAIAGCGIALSATGCDQPVPDCTAGRGSWTMVYTVKSGPPECADTTVDVYGMQVYNASKADGTADLKHSSVAIQADYLGYAAQNAVDWEVPPDPAQKWYAFGAFTTAQPEGDFCNVPTMAPAKVDVPEVPAIDDDPATEEDESYPGDPAISFEYDWSNVQFYVTPEVLGSVMRGDVKVTIDSLACNYSAIGVYYNVYCGSTITEPIPDPDNPSSSVSCADDPAICEDYDATCVGVVCHAPVTCQDQTECDQYGAICNGYGECERADQKLCDPAPDPDNGYPYGSGINPEVPMRCDEATMMCVPNGTPPQLQ